MDLLNQNRCTSIWNPRINANQPELNNTALEIPSTSALPNTSQVDFSQPSTSSTHQDISYCPQCSHPRSAPDPHRSCLPVQDNHFRG